MKIMLSKALVFAVIVLFIGAGFVPSISSDGPFTKGTVYVDDDALPSWYDATHVKTIQEGIDNATVGDTVYVYNGTYYENVVVGKTINLTGEDRNSTIIDGGGVGDVVYVSADWVNISGFRIQNSGGVNNPNHDAGIDIRSDHNHIINNKISFNNCFGIHIWESDFNSIIGNNLSYNNEDGIQITYYSIENTILNNIINSNGNDGIALGFHSSNAFVKNNMISQNGQYGIICSYSTNNLISYNNIISNYQKGMHLQLISDNNFIFHNNFIDNSINSYDECFNNWYYGYPSGGNYWDDYTGVDNYHGVNQDIPGSDGIGDTPYPISGGINQDNYPLMNPNSWINNSPYPPSNPSPFNGETGVSTHANLYWTGGDPDLSDTVKYDIYFGTSVTPPKIRSNHPYTYYYLSTLQYGTQYYWRIVARDNHGYTTSGPLWTFETVENNPPYTPSNPMPISGATDVSVEADLHWTGGDPDPADTVTYDIYFGDSTPPPKIVSNHPGTTYDPGTMDISTTYYWKIVAKDNHGASVAGPIWYFTTIETLNNPPNKPSRPTGPSYGKIRRSYSYSSSTIDPDEDQISYKFDWDDGTNSGWVGPYNSGETLYLSHVWITSGSYSIKVKAKDEHGAESPWSDPLPITMPKNKAINLPFLQFLENHPHLFPLLQQLLEL